MEKQGMPGYVLNEIQTPHLIDEKSISQDNHHQSREKPQKIEMGGYVAY